jgi:hypothetical protein
VFGVTLFKRFIKVFPVNSAGKQRQLVPGIYQVRQSGAKKFAMVILGQFSCHHFPVFCRKVTKIG